MRIGFKYKLLTLDGATKIVIIDARMQNTETIGDQIIWEIKVKYRRLCNSYLNN